VKVTAKLSIDLLQPYSKTEAITNPWQFASGYLDANTGLYKFGERYYDPQVGRWTQKDPVGGSLGSVNSTNPYVYANNLPNMLVDPSGRDANPGVCLAATGYAIPTAWQLFQALLKAGTFIIQGGVDVAETIPPFFELGIAIAAFGVIVIGVGTITIIAGLYEVVATSCGLNPL